MNNSPYGRRKVDVLGSLPTDERPPTYYGLPAVKPSHWGWLIASYFFVGGLAGAAQVIAQVADSFDRESDRAAVSAGRYLALLGALASPVFLIADLRTPSRWYNMLRIFRGTSPMSIGSWTLAAFGTFSGLAALAQALADLTHGRVGRGAARLFGVPAALAGGMMAIYTGTLLSATATPLWSSVPRLLPALFGISGTSTATAAISLITQRQPSAWHARRRLSRLALLASLTELVLSLAVDRAWRAEGMDEPLKQQPIAAAYPVGVLGLGVAVPIVVRTLEVLRGRDLGWLSTFASLATLAGGYTQRVVVLFAGKRSAQRPEDYFRQAQPEAAR